MKVVRGCGTESNNGCVDDMHEEADLLNLLAEVPNQFCNAGDGPDCLYR